MKKLRKCDFEMKPLDQCSREENADGESEYDAMITLSRMPDEFTHKEFKAELAQVLTNRTLSSLIDKGAIEAVWDPEQEDFVFFPKDKPIRE